MTTLADLPASGTRNDGSAVVRLLGYNIRSMRDDVPALARVIRACAPDAVCVQEAPRFFGWRRHAERLARRTGLVHVTGGATGNGTLIMAAPDAGVLRTRDVLLPWTPGLHRRGFATAVLRFGSSAPLGVVSCHLSLQREERLRQAWMLLNLPAVTAPSAAVVAGDLNERPGGPAFRRLAGQFQDGWAVAPWGGEHTSESRRPHQRIDAVLAGPALEVLGCGVPVGLPGVSDADLVAATDHLPVLAALRVPPDRLSSG